MADDHSDYHSKDAFCGSAGPAELRHLHEMVEKLTDQELQKLVKICGIAFSKVDRVPREELEGVIDEIEREDFYRIYELIIHQRQKNL